jgi:amino acid transporter
MSDTSTRGSLGFWSVAAMGVGGMVGGGIFAVLGLAVQLAHGGTPVAFALAGVVALVTAHAYARLSAAYPSQGGTVEFLTQAYGTGVVTGALNVLLWLSYVVMLSLYAYAFGSYGASFAPEETRWIWRHGLTSGAVVALTALNAVGADLVGRAEEWIVGAKVSILLVFVGVGLVGLPLAPAAPAHWTSPLELAAGGMIIFLAYEGFELIANAAQDARQPERTLPRALYASVAFVIVLYVLISLIVVGRLSIGEVAAARDYALAEAARPLLGQAGFAMIAVAVT